MGKFRQNIWKNKMASNRRSSRGVAKEKKKYKEFDSDDEEAKLAIFDDSGSDFENDLKKQNGSVASNKLKQKEPSSSSECSSGEDEAKIEAEESLKAFKAESQSRKKFDAVSSLKSLNRKREKLLETQTTKKKQVKYVEK